MELALAILGVILVESLQNAPAWAGIYTLRSNKSLLPYVGLMTLAAVAIELTEPIKLALSDQSTFTPQFSSAMINAGIFIIGGLLVYTYLRLTDHCSRISLIDLFIVATIGIAMGLLQSGHDLVHALALGLAGILTLYSLRTQDKKLMIVSWATSSIAIALLDYIIPNLL